MSSPDPVALGASLASRFDRMVRSDGGSVRLIGVEDDVIRMGYRPGADPDCEDGVCVLPEYELQTMIAEILTAQAPTLRVTVERVAD